MTAATSPRFTAVSDDGLAYALNQVQRATRTIELALQDITRSAAGLTQELADRRHISLGAYARLTDPAQRFATAVAERGAWTDAAASMGATAVQIHQAVDPAAKHFFTSPASALPAAAAEV